MCYKTVLNEFTVDCFPPVFQWSCLLKAVWSLFICIVCYLIHPSMVCEAAYCAILWTRIYSRDCFVIRTISNQLKWACSWRFMPVWVIICLYLLFIRVGGGGQGVPPGTSVCTVWMIRVESDNRLQCCNLLAVYICCILGHYIWGEDLSSRVNRATDYYCIHM